MPDSHTLERVLREPDMPARLIAHSLPTHKSFHARGNGSAWCRRQAHTCAHSATLCRQTDRLWLRRFGCIWWWPGPPLSGPSRAPVRSTATAVAPRPPARRALRTGRLSAVYIAFAEILHHHSAADERQ